jgi:cytochrome c556
MRHLVRVGIVAAALAAVIGGGVVSSRADDAEAVIKMRRDAMKRQGEDLKAVADYLKGEADQATAEAKVQDLITLNPHIVELFVPGTGMDKFPGKTGAKPEIWAQWDKFTTLPAGLKDEEEKLAAAIKSGDKGAVAAQLAQTGKNGCGTCHTPYREKLS